jgi:CheY-like chemotaxis protein
MFACIKFLTYKNDDVGLIIRAIDVPYRKKKEPTNQMIIQVVDDEFDIVNLIKLCLQEIGLNAVGFTDSSLAFEHFRINSKDCMLVISDIRIPGMNGFEFVRKIRDKSCSQGLVDVGF